MHSQINMLAPIDLAQDAESQVRYSVEVARSLTADLTLLYVGDPLRPLSDRRIEWPPGAMAEHPDGRMRRVDLRGSVAETVTGYADENGSDLIVLGSRHYGSWARVWKNSVAASILASTHRPVWVTRKMPIGPAAHKTFRRILCLVSLEGTDEAVVRYADSLTARLQGALHLLHLIPEVPESLFMYSAAEIEWRRLAERSAASRLQDLANGLHSPHSTSMLSGPADKSIKRAVREFDADLVVTGRPPPDRNQTGRAILDLGTLHSRLRCPLLSVAVKQTCEAELSKDGVVSHF